MWGHRRHAVPCKQAADVEKYPYLLWPPRFGDGCKPCSWKEGMPTGFLSLCHRNVAEHVMHVVLLRFVLHDQAALQQDAQLLPGKLHGLLGRALQPSCRSPVLQQVLFLQSYQTSQSTCHKQQLLEYL